MPITLMPVTVLKLRNIFDNNRATFVSTGIVLFFSHPICLFSVENVERYLILTRSIQIIVFLGSLLLQKSYADFSMLKSVVQQMKLILYVLIVLTT